MPKFNLRLAEIINNSHDTKTFRFSMESADFNLLPGQFVMASTTIEGKLVRRAYSVSSSPLEKRFIELTIKCVENGLFSCYMHEKAKVGDIFAIEGPYGKFIYKDSDEPVVLISAGCGIAPLMSILRYILGKKLQVHVTLLHSCKTQNDMLFEEELKKLSEANKNFKYIATLTRETNTDWEGCIGRFDRGVIETVIKDKKNTSFFISGPVLFGHDIKKILGEIGIDKEKVKEEVF